MLQAKQKRAQDTRLRVLTAARALFDDVGYEAASTDEIAARAGVSKGTVFAHFGDKSGLLAEIGAADLQQHLVQMEAGAAGARADEPAIDQIIETLEAMLDYFDRSPVFLRLFIDEAGWRSGPRSGMFGDILGRLHQVFQRLIEKGQADGSIRAIEPGLAATSLRAFMMHYAVGRVCGEYADRAARSTEMRKVLAALLWS